MTPFHVVQSIPILAKSLSKAAEKESKRKSISKLTDLCKDLQKKQEVEDQLGPHQIQQVSLAYVLP